MLAATTGGGGTIRLREGDYISPPTVLSPRAQLVNFPPDQVLWRFQGTRCRRTDKRLGRGAAPRMDIPIGGFSGAVRKECTKPFNGIVRVQVAFHDRTSQVLTNGHLV